MPAVNPSIFVKVQFVLDSGLPAVGNKLYFYQAGSTTKQATFTDSTGSASNANPITLNTLGEPDTEIWFAAGLSYKVIYANATDSDPPTSPIWSIDNLRGINDATITIDQWQSSGLTPTFINTTQFSVLGDQTSVLQVNRRLKITESAGTVYGYISSSVFSAGITTVTMVLDSGTLDSGISTVYYGVLSASGSSVPANYVTAQALQNRTHIAATTSGTSTAYTLAFAQQLATLVTNQLVNVTFHAASGATPTLAISGLTAKSLKYYDQFGAKQSIFATQIPVSWNSDVWYDGTDYIVNNIPKLIAPSQNRHTVISGPVDANGLPNFGGSTGATTVTMTGTLTACALNGYGSFGMTQRVGQITNAAWTGLSVNGTMYLALDVNQDGTCTTASMSLAPAYINGGTPSVTSGQFTYDRTKKTAYVGNGSSAVQTYRVVVGQVTVAGGVVTAIVWYALNGRYDGPFTATLPGTATRTSQNHNIGVMPDTSDFIIECTTANLNFAVGDQLHASSLFCNDGTLIASQPVATNGTTIAITTGASVAFYALNSTTGVFASLTAASWKYKFLAETRL